MTTTTDINLDALAQSITNRRSFDALMTEVNRGWAPTLRQTQRDEIELGDAIERAGGRVFWRR